jgi:Carboxypeptidase regulatory-like domain
MRRWTGGGIPRGVVRVVATLCLVAGVRSASAQQIRGVVRDSTTSAPLPAVVVSALDSTGATLTRTIANANGEFSLSRPPRIGRLRAIRIGYRPRDVPVPEGTRPVEFVMARIPPILEAVRVSDHELCPGSPDRGSAFQLWDQARAGLLAAIVAREANPATATTLTFERRMFPGDDLVRRQTVEVHNGRTTRPFVAFAAPSRFAAAGYLRESGSDRLFLAPDADVLLDESFAATHCFHLQASDAGHSEQIGLAFVPVPGRPDSLVDVSGVIWIDRSTPALRSFDFRYTSLEPAAIRAEAGGHLEFKSVANGVSFIDWWSLRLPVLVGVPRLMTSTPTTSSPPSARRQDRRDVRVDEIQESGGQVLESTWSDGVKWRDPPSGISGSVTQRADGRAAARARVTLAGTSETTTADDHGNFTLAPLVPGRYSVTVADTSLGAFAPPRSEASVVDVRRGEMTALTMEVPSAMDAINQVCRGQRPVPNTTTIAGRVLLPTGSPPQGGVVSASWQADFSVAGGSVGISTAKRSIDVDSEGRFLFCGVAPDRPVRLTLTFPGGVADTTVQSFETVLKSVEWRPTPRRP